MQKLKTKNTIKNSKNIKYKILPHPAELRLRIYGKTIEELFKNAAEAMADVLSSRFKIQSSKLQFKSQKLKIISIDLNSLLVDFLSEILTKSQINRKVYLIKKIKIDKDETALKSEIISYPINRFDKDIKAVTYEDLDIKKHRGKWQTNLVFDI